MLETKTIKLKPNSKTSYKRFLMDLNLKSFKIFQLRSGCRLTKDFALFLL